MATACNESQDSTEVKPQATITLSDKSTPELPPQDEDTLLFDHDEGFLVERPEFGAAPRLPASLYTRDLTAPKESVVLRPRLGPWIDVDELRHWLNYCDEHHQDHCLSLSEQTFQYRPRWVVDVTLWCLVPTESHRYVALSYVWGTEHAFKTLQADHDMLQIEGSLREKSLPRTIHDVIELTRRLGERFLWVDALCIIQDNDDEKAEHLSYMGSIYANAYVTVAAVGGSALQGLRGLDNCTPPMVRDRRGDYTLEKTIMYHRSFLQRSTWNQRAWTFQEQIFSRRMIIFDECEVSWECHCTIWFEGMEVRESQCMDNREVVAPGFAFRVPADLWDYAHHVEKYNSRLLTYPGDALDAFTGILTVLEPIFIGGFICGLPRMFFDTALLWYNKAPLERRLLGLPKFPTWAWIAWHGKIAFREQDQSIPIVQPLVDWAYRADSGAEWQRISSGTTKDEKECAWMAPTCGSPCPHLLFTYAFRAWLRIDEVYPPVQVLLVGHGGMLTSCEEVTPMSRGQDCEVVMVSQPPKDGPYNVLWIEWRDGVAYRKGAGWVSKGMWAAQKLEQIPLFLG